MSAQETSAELPIRLAARAIDIIILAAAGFALGKAMGFGFSWLLVTAAIVILYFTLMDAWVGATLGKLATGLRVIAMDGSRPSIAQAFIREAFMLLGAIPFAGPVLALAALIWIIVTIRASPLRRGKHDELAGTRVVVA